MEMVFFDLLYIQISTDLYSPTFSCLHPMNFKLPVLFCAETGSKDAGNTYDTQKMKNAAVKTSKRNSGDKTEIRWILLLYSYR